MRETRYMISDASKKVEVEAHVLRYWEEELGLTIPRNELGHRYYTEENIALLTSIRKLKEKGFQLRAIKLLLSDIHKVEALEPEQLYNLRDKLDVILGIERETDEERPLENLSQELVPTEQEQGKVYVTDELNQGKLIEFRSIMDSIISEAIERNNTILVQDVSDSVHREMEYFLRVKEEQEEERFKQLDRTIREYQQLRQQGAAAKELEEKKPRKKSKFFQKNKVRI